MESFFKVVKTVAGLLVFICGGFLLFLFNKKPKITDVTEKVKELDKKEEVVKSELKDIEKKQEILKKEGVKEMTPEEEIEYWKNNAK